MEWLRSALDDDLLVRSGGAYERTPRGDQLRVDLQNLLPRLDAAVRGNRIDVAAWNDRGFNDIEAGRIHLAVTDGLSFNPAQRSAGRRRARRWNPVTAAQKV